MARLGVRTVDELVGRSDLLKRKEQTVTPHAARVDLTNVLENPYVKEPVKVIYDPAQAYDFQLEKTKDVKVLLKKLKGPLAAKQKREK